MKKISLLAFFCMTLTVIATAQTADTLADHQTKCFFQYLSALPTQSSDKVISGQWMHNRGLPQTPQTEFDSSITSIYNQTSKFVGAIGINYLREIVWPNSVITHHAAVNQILIDYFQQGGLVHVMVHWENPWTGNSQNDTTGASNLLDLITPGNSAYTQFKRIWTVSPWDFSNCKTVESR